jgi:carboxyl-terminal processing protease
MSVSHPQLRLHLALGLVFGAVLATGTAAGAWGSEGPLSHRPVSVDAAARAWVDRTGDRWAAYYGPEQYAAMTEALGGRYAGVGLWVVRSPSGAVTVSRLLDGGPAAKASVRAGDLLLAVDGRPVAGLPVTDVVALLRGGSPVAGTVVALTLQRQGLVRRVVLHRQLLEAEDVVVDHPAAGITRIAVSAFTTGTGDQVQAAVQQSADNRARGILLDLRGNSGGLVDESVESASGFLNGGPVGSYQADGTTYRLTADPGGDTGVPVVVLVDGGTMSAAELLTGALQDRGRAVVVGSRTFGKGAVQQPTPLPGGAVVERTVGHYRTPDGHDLDGAGITPDVSVPVAEGPQAAERTAITVLDDLAGLDGR